MKRFLAVFIIGGLALLSACGGDKPPVTPPVTPPPSTGVVTPIGTNIGSPVVGSIDASGGTLSAGEVTVSAPAGAFSNASLTLQAISDTFNDAGQGIAISSDASWNKYLTVTFPIDPSEESPESLSLAVQQSDGSWRSLEPVKVDLAAGTVSAGLPAVTEVSASRVRAQGGLDLKRVIKFKKYYFKPPSATVKVGKSQTFVPYAQVLERPKGCPKTTPDPDADLAPLLPKCFKPLEREYPFTNDKDGFTRPWKVNGIFNGDSTVGTIAPSSGSGATYTAPDKKPSPDIVTVSFQSVNSDTLDSVSIKPPAKVKITGDVIQTYTGPYNSTELSNGGSTVLQGDLTWTLDSSIKIYRASGSIKVTKNISGCSSVSGSVPVTGDMTVNGTNSLDPSTGNYIFNFGGQGVTVFTKCSGNPNPVPVLLVVIVASGCYEDYALRTYTDIFTLNFSKQCQAYKQTLSWNFVGQ